MSAPVMAGLHLAVIVWPLEYSRPEDSGELLLSHFEYRLETANIARLTRRANASPVFIPRHRRPAVRGPAACGGEAVDHRSRPAEVHLDRGPADRAGRLGGRLRAGDGEREGEP